MRPLFNVFPQQLPDPAKVFKKYINQNIYYFMFFARQVPGTAKVFKYCFQNISKNI